MNQRKNIDWLTSAELTAFRVALQKIKDLPGSDPGSYGAIAAIHGKVCPHHSELFLPWHRAYLLLFERALQKFDASVTLPYWNWITSGGVAMACQGDATNPLWLQDRYTNSNRPAATHYPTQQEVNDALAFTTFLEFGGGPASAGHLETGPHGEIHDWVGKTMAFPDLAANDPVFWLHHCYVDNLWRQWQDFNSGVPSNLDAAFPGLSGKVGDVLNTSALGYEYVGATVAVNFPGGLKPSGAISEPFCPRAGTQRAEIEFQGLHIMSKLGGRIEVVLHAASGASVTLNQPLFGFIMDPDGPMAAMRPGGLHVDVTAALDRLFGWDTHLVAGVRLLTQDPTPILMCVGVRLVLR